eukprot:CAMPEP_0119036614 /NCGR_PEP_ID=MMETSP1177-20130426/4440_1 /TAXON_ID=2985 /ORGANISM="Ochromonas sp, Strain CCMP1899" /LENGTH=239 /DNA_ID=CAMNT_0006996747 /DNA_START=721 /DNA_END=1440 /DNA_ORIENTATION=-
MPGLSRGLIRVELYDISKATFIKAHDADLAQIALNADGSLLATASEKGTLIRLWDCHTGDLLREFRRGMDRADIYSICFNLQNTFLACSSDKGTVHIFSLTKKITGDSHNGGANQDENPSPTRETGYSPQQTTDESIENSDKNTPNKSLGLNFLRGIVPKRLMPKYLNSEWSYAQVRGIEGKSICAFDKDTQNIVVVCADGTFICSSFLEPGDCSRLTTIRFLKPPEESENGDFGDEEN